VNNFGILSVADRFSQTLDGLCRAVAARIAPGMAGWAMQAAMIVVVWGKLRRIEGKVQGLLARFLAGKLRARKSGVRPVSVAPRSGRSGSSTVKLPRRFGWLLALVPYEAANFSSQLRHLMGDPEMEAFLKASPQARRVLAPMCRMLGIEAQVLQVGVLAPPKPAAADAVPEAEVRTLPKPPWPTSRTPLSAMRSSRRLPRLFPPGAG